MARVMPKMPLYQELYETLRGRIRSGEYPPDSPLPSETKLHREFGVSLITVRRAVHELALDGLIDTRQGIGSIVRDSSQAPIVVGMSSFTADVAAGRLPIVRTLMFDNYVQAPIEIAEKLAVAQGSMLRRLVRLDQVGGEPMSIDEVYLPPALAVEITPEIAASPLFLDLWQERSSISVALSTYDIFAQPSSPSDQEMLQIGAEVPVLVAGELLTDASGKAVMWVVSRYRGDRCRLSCTVALVPRSSDDGSGGGRS